MTQKETPDLTDTEKTRLNWLIEVNTRRLGERYRDAAVEMALCQIGLERQGDSAEGENHAEQD